MSNLPRTLLVLGALATMASTGIATAQPRGSRDGSGPAGVACQADIEQHCKGLSHGAGAVRSCLESNRAKVSKACAAALEGTGFGRRQR